MFNGAFLSEPVVNESDLERRIISAGLYFSRAGVKWSFWLSDSFLPHNLVRGAGHTFAHHDLRLATEMPGMIARTIGAPAHQLPACELRPLDNSKVLADFRDIGSACFRVPLGWFSEVFDDQGALRSGFRASVGYVGDKPIGTTATVVSDGAIGLYNLATVPDYRSRGFGEALMRQSIAAEVRDHPDLPVVLQSTKSGLPLYKRLGFVTVTRFRVFVN